MKFEVGEIAICVVPGSLNYGREVTILTPLKWMRMWEGGGTYRVLEAHEVDAPFAGVAPKGCWAVEPAYLRKRPPKRDWKTICNLHDIPREVERV